MANPSIPQPSIKPQPTLSGYNAWAFQRLMVAKGMKPGPLGAWIIDRWIEANAALLEQSYQIHRSEYAGRDNVLPYRGSGPRSPSAAATPDGGD